MSPVTPDAMQVAVPLLAVLALVLGLAVSLGRLKPDRAEARYSDVPDDPWVWVPSGGFCSSARGRMWASYDPVEFKWLGGDGSYMVDWIASPDTDLHRWADDGGPA